MCRPKGKSGRALTGGSQEPKSQCLESHGTVHQVEIQIIQLEGSKCFLACFLHQWSLVGGGPQLWGKSKAWELLSQPHDHRASLAGKHTAQVQRQLALWHIFWSWWNATFVHLILFAVLSVKWNENQLLWNSNGLHNNYKDKSRTGENQPASFQQIEVTLFFLPLLLGEKTKQNITQGS